MHEKCERGVNGDVRGVREIEGSIEDNAKKGSKNDATTVRGDEIESDG